MSGAKGHLNLKVSPVLLDRRERMDKSRILIVEDERITSDHLRRLLTRLGYEVVGIANNGMRALELLKNLDVDLVIVDIGLPGNLDGVQIAQQAREDYDIPAVFLTAYSDPDTIRRARVSEPYGYIVKPFVEEELHATIEIALQQHTERRRRTREALATTQVLAETKEELRAVTGRLFRIQEKERAQISRDLHDDVGQRVALLQISIETLWQRLPPEFRDAHAAALDNIVTDFGTLSWQLRDISHRLHPSILDDLGLVAALRSLAENFESRYLRPTRVIAQNLPEQISLELSVELYRICQEALNNVVRHAGEDVTVTITLQGTSGGLAFSICDTGPGIDRNNLRASHGLGIKSMAERADLIGGILAIETVSGQGTCIRVRVPLTESSAMPEDRRERSDRI